MLCIAVASYANQAFGLSQTLQTLAGYSCEQHATGFDVWLKVHAAILRIGAIG